MADKYVIFPGGTGNHISTQDVNLLDADTSHLAQSQGQWVLGSGGTGVWVSNSGDYGKLTQTITTPNSYERWNTINQTSPTIQAGAFICSFDVNNQQSTERGFYGRFWIDGASQGDLAFVVPPGISRQSFTQSLPAGVLTHLWIVPHGLNNAAGDKHEYSKICVREGFDPTFIPSLDIIGTLGETIDPTGMPIAYTPGTPLTAGEAWAGNGNSYIRYDGPTGIGPVVAEFDPDDIVLP